MSCQNTNEIVELSSPRSSIVIQVDDIQIWDRIDEEFIKNREEVEAFKNSQNKDCQVPLCPTVQYIESEVFVILVDIMEQTLKKAIETKSLKYHKSPFNAIDYIVELLWNFNPRHPERYENQTYLFDMEWVIKLLEDFPRPYFPFSWIWSKDYAAIKIQSYMRGHWVRRRPEVQEMRQFWKVVKKEMEGEFPNRLPSVMWPCLPFYEPPLEGSKGNIQQEPME